jgi:uncharacterized membrane protein YccC
LSTCFELYPSLSQIAWNVSFVLIYSCVFVAFNLDDALFRLLLCLIFFIVIIVSFRTKIPECVMLLGIIKDWLQNSIIEFVFSCVLIPTEHWPVRRLNHHTY